MFSGTHFLRSLTSSLANTLLSLTLNKRQNGQNTHFWKMKKICCLYKFIFLLKTRSSAPNFNIIFPYSTDEQWTRCLCLRLWYFNGSKIRNLSLVSSIDRILHADHHRNNLQRRSIKFFIYVHICSNKRILSFPFPFCIYRSPNVSPNMIDVEMCISKFQFVLWSCSILRHSSHPKSSAHKHAYTCAVHTLFHTQKYVISV